MGRVNDTVGTVNTTLRTLLLLVLVGGAGYGGYKAYEVYNEPRQQLADKEAELHSARDSLQKANNDLAARQQQIEELNASLAEKAAQVERLEVAMRLLKVRRRLARLTVLDQRERAPADNGATAEASAEAAESPNNLVTRIEFVEVNEKGDPIGEAKQFDIVGDMVYIDYQQVTFDDKYVEQADLDRSTSIVLFHRVFGEYQEAVEGFQLDTVGTRPTAYARGTQMSDFEKSIWNDFWLIANDSQRAADLGIYAAHGSAISMRVRPQTTYEIELRSTGTMTMRPVVTPPAAAPASD
jgi:uncharacterized coiled-coil protein SlyX